MSTLEAKVEQLFAERDHERSALVETEDEVAALKMELAAQRRENNSMREAIERITKDLRSQAAQPVNELRGELQSAVAESASLRAQLSVATSQIDMMQQMLHEQAAQLRDVATLKAQQGFVQAAADRADLATTEQTRLLGEVRSELAGLQQRHAALASASVAEKAAQSQAASQLRSSAETLSMQYESLQAEMGSIRADNTAANESCEKLKKAAKRHELLLHRMTEVHETRASELRGLIKALSDQLKPLHETSRRHASQIEEVSSGINVLAELLRFTNRNRTQTLADALHSVGV